MKSIIICLCITASVFLYSCDDKPQPSSDIVLPIPLKGWVYIMNEGNFQFGNASLNLLDIAEDKLTENAFEKVNGRKLGDVFQSTSVINGKAYLVVNNSAKIEVVNAISLQSLATIQGFTSPRYMLQVDANRAYVSQYYANNIAIVDLNTNTIIDSIPAGGWTEEMLLHNNKVYVTNTRRSYIYVINPSTNKIEDTIQAGYSSNSIQLDAQNNIWILCNGNTQNGDRPLLQRINTKADSVDLSFSLTTAQADVTRLRINKEGTQLYWLSKNVYTHAISSASIETTPFVRAVGQNFYGLGINKLTNEIWVSDAKDFVQQSIIAKYRSDGTLIGTLKGGIITGDFYFYYP
jgi:YVTN family beta-propeller protein